MDVQALYLNWEGAFLPDQGAGGVTFAYALGTARGGSQIVPFTAVGNSTSAVVLGPPARLGLQPGVPVFASVAATDAVGNVVTYSDASPIIWSPSGPLPGIVKDANLDNYAPSAFAGSTMNNSAGGSHRRMLGAALATESRGRGSLRSRAKRSTPSSAVANDNTPDCGGNIFCHQLRVQTSLAGVAAARPKPLALATVELLSQARAPKPDNAMTGLGFAALRRLGSNSTNSSSAADAFSTPAPLTYNWRLDTTLTSIALVVDAGFSTSCDRLDVTFEAFYDVSGLAGYAACAGSAPLRCDLVPAALVDARAGVPTAQSVTLAGLSLPRGAPVFATVFALSGAGAVASSSSDGLVCDDRGPSAAAAVVLDTGAHFFAPPSVLGAGRAANGGVSAVDINCDLAGAGVGAAWRGFEAFVGLARYDWAVGTAPGADDMLHWTSVGVATSIFNASVLVPAGNVAYVSVRAIDVAGRAAVATSNGVLMLPPLSAPGGNSSALAAGAVSRANITAAVAAANGTAAAAVLARSTFACVSGPVADSPPLIGNAALLKAN
jgi:hypothetical protein